MNAVRNQPKGRETLVVFASDNGGERYSKMWPFVGRKWDLLEGGLRVPQIVWWPGHIPSGQVVDQTCITMDLTATCLSAAGVASHPDYPLDGDDLLPVLTGQRPEYERTLYWRMANRQQRAIRRGDWKYLKVADKEFLFDIAYDPRERSSLAHKQPERLAALRSQWEAWNATMLPVPERMIPPTWKSCRNALVIRRAGYRAINLPTECDHSEAGSISRLRQINSQPLCIVQTAGRRQRTRHEKLPRLNQRHFHEFKIAAR